MKSYAQFFKKILAIVRECSILYVVEHLAVVIQGLKLSWQRKRERSPRRKVLQRRRRPARSADKFSTSRYTKTRMYARLLLLSR